MAVPVNQVGSELCQLLGLDPNLVSSIKFEWAPGTIATIEVSIIANGSDGSLIQTLKRYQLVQEV